LPFCKIFNAVNYSLESDLVGTEESIGTSDIERLEKNKDVIGLIDVLKYGNPESRAYTAISLGRLRNERAFQHLFGCNK